MKLDIFKPYDFFTGVPDSQLKPLCNFLMHTYGISDKHIIAANEGNAVALAAGYHLATGKVPVVYLQNSGIGNIINPVASLMNDKVYGIPCIFIIGWRGEPGVHDEPQHIYQGEVTLKLLDVMGIRAFVICQETTEKEVRMKMAEFQPLLDAGKQVAFVIRKDAFEFDVNVIYTNEFHLRREEIIRQIVEIADEDLIVSTTGKASRELYEIREQNGQDHKCDFMTVGSMGHCSSIALGISLQRPEKRIWIIDGDGAALMHMGSMAILGANSPANIIHIIINNGAHESVGGMPTIAGKIDFVQIAKGCRYPNTMAVNNLSDLKNALAGAKEENKLTLIDVKCAIGARDNLGRPTATAKENKIDFMSFLQNS